MATSQGFSTTDRPRPQLAISNVAINSPHIGAPSLGVIVGSAREAWVNQRVRNHINMARTIISDSPPECRAEVFKRDTAPSIAGLVSDYLLTRVQANDELIDIATANGLCSTAERREHIEYIAREAIEYAETTRGPRPGQTKPGSSNGHDQDAKPVVLVSVRASQIEMQAIDWLWPDRFALGKVGLIVGLPDEGKGQIFCDMAARITNGGEWPCEEDGKAKQGNIIILTAEDDPSDTVVPRLKAAGADLDRVHIIKMVCEHGKSDRMFSLVTDLTLLRQKVIEIGNVVQIQIDPVSAYLGFRKMDTFRTTDVRAVLSPLVDLATELHISIVGIMHFNKKVDITNALLRISDSLAFGATARHVYAVVDDPANKRKLLVRGKNNLGKKEQQALAYGFGVQEVGYDARLGKPIIAPHILWFGHVDVSASEAMQAATTTDGTPSARDEAKKLITDLLAGGPARQQVVEDAAKAEMISTRTLKRAKKELGVISRKVGMDHWEWELPEECHPRQRGG